MHLIHALVLLLLAHWVGDYLLQFNVIANLKGESLMWLSIHVLLYSVVLLVFTFFLLPWRDAVLFSVINGGFHFITDMITSRVATRYKSNPRIFFPVIGFDQLIHTVTLTLTAGYYMG